MSIHDDIAFDKEGEVIRPSVFRRLFLPLIIVLVAGLCFGIGRLSAGQGSPSVKIENDPNIINELSSTTPTKVTPLSVPDQSASVYASSKGTKYYYMNCHSTVSAANKVTFTTSALAEKAGYSLSATCRP